MAENTLYYGDNLDVLKRYVADESVDLVYLDPPFKSSRSYNVLFEERDGTQSAAQIKAFDDTWQWDMAAEAAYRLAVDAGERVAKAVIALRTFLGQNDMMAYLAMMAPRLVELHRVLKATGSIWLHCDPTASHYLKMLMDAVFGPERFQAEVIWKRSFAHSDTKQGMKRPGRIHDTLLFYTRSDEWTWNPQYTSYDQSYLDTHYRHIDQPSGRRYGEVDCTAAKPGGDTEYEWRVKRVRDTRARWVPDFENEYQNPKAGMEYKCVRPYVGRFWAYSKKNLEQFWHEGKLLHRSTGAPRLIQFADEMPGVSLQDMWPDIPPELGENDMGYQTQKPEALLRRIIVASTHKGELVLDPFCGCGTAIVVAQQLERQWVGIDVTHLAISLIKNRMYGRFADKAPVKVIGEPVSVQDAERLSEEDPWQFQWWALSLVNARPVEQKKGADRGIDGRIYIDDEGDPSKIKQIILQVKAGKTDSKHIRDLRGVIERDKAAIGVFISMREPSKPMRTEAAQAGFYDSPGWNQSYPRLQLLTIEELLGGKKIDMPPSKQVSVTHRRAPRVKGKPSEKMGKLFDKG